MKQKALYTDIFREIRQTLGRFISIVLLIAIGTLAYTGLRISGPNMIQTTAHYLEEFQVADAVVQSTYGLDEIERTRLLADDAIDYVEFLKEVEMTIEGTQHTMKLQSIPQELSLLEVKEGRLPQSTNEIALDAVVQKDTYVIGDTVRMVDKETSDKSDDTTTLKQKEYIVVGFVRTPENVIDQMPGDNGEGGATAFGAVQEDVIDMDVYTAALVRFKSTSGLKLYSDAYEKAVDEGVDQLEKSFEDMPDVRLKAIKQDAQKEIRNAERELADGRKKLKDGEQELKDAEQQLAEGQSSYRDGVATAESELSDAARLLATLSQELAEGKITLDAAQKELDQNRQKLNEEKTKLLAQEAEVQAGLNEVAQGLEQVESGLVALQDAITTLDEQMSYMQATRPQMDSQKQQLEVELTTLQNQEAQIQSEIEGYINTGQDVPQILYDALEQVQNGTGIIQENILLLETQMAEVDNGFPEMMAARTYLESEVSALEQTKQELIATKAMLEEALTQIAQGKQLIVENERLLNEGQAMLTAERQKVVDGEIAIAENQEKLETARQTLAAELASALSELQKGEAELADGKTTFETEKIKAAKEITKGEKELKDVKQDIADLKDPIYIMTGRTANSSYTMIGESTQGLDILGIVIPAFIFFVAMLVSLTTMSRMVDEQRMQMGTLKSLGYNNRDIRKKYIIYGALASTLGIFVGVITGHYVLPRFIFAAYQDMFTFRPFEFHFSVFNTIVSCVVGYLCTVGVAYIVSNNLLKENAASLMRGPAPASGSRILLERIPFIWQRLSFTYKVTFRNLFRYKQRMFMTIIGVAGCTALILMGIGLYESIESFGRVQFESINNYDVMVVYDSDAHDADKLQTELENDDRVTRSAAMFYNAFTAQVPGVSQQSVSVIVPDNMQDFSEMTFLGPRGSTEPQSLDETGVIMSEKLMALFDLKQGDTLSIKNIENETFDIPVVGTTQELVQHKIYMSKAEYDRIFGESYKTNAYMMNLENNDAAHSQRFIDEYGENAAVLSTMTVTDFQHELDDLLNSLQAIIIIIIFLASLLALVVLYNLTNINVAERERELSTIKVLGFYDKEVTAYIYRETLILTFIGIFIGFIPGIILHSYICKWLPPGAIMFPLDVSMRNYFLTTLFTLAVSLGVMFVMHRKMKNVDMVEALKSVE